MANQAQPEDVARAFAALEQYLHFMKDEGLREVELDPARLDALCAAVRQPQARPYVQAGDGASPARAVREPPAAVAQPAVGASDTDAALKGIAAEVAACEKCRLCKSRTRVVPGQGALTPEIMFIGEGPGADEDRQGLAFVGRAGQLLTKIIEAMGYARNQVFIGNVVKCRPPDNRTPMPDEMASCLPYLERQIELLKPKVIVALGATAVKGLFGDPKLGIMKIRGRWMAYRGIDVMPTFHPAYLLRNPPSKREVWEDMKAVLARLGRAPPPRKP